VRGPFLIASLWLVAGTALAQDAPPAEPAPPADPAPEEGQGAAASGQPENIDATREARERFQAGLAHFGERRFREAIREFELAGQLVPSADLWFNIARAHEELSEYDRAVEYYQRYLRDRVDPPDRERVEAHIASLTERAEAQRQALRETPTTGTLRITSSEAGAAIAVDGRGLGTAPIAAPLSLPPGRHRLSVHREGFIPFESEVQVEAGVITAAHADLQRATDYRSIQGSRIFTWITAGLAVVALGASIYFGARAAGAEADARDASDTTAMQDELDRAESLALKSDLALAGAVTLAIGSVVLWFLEGSSVGTERVEVEATATASAD
jgi:tetratricopeptide (TPR) repeat protein